MSRLLLSRHIMIHATLKNLSPLDLSLAENWCKEGELPVNFYDEHNYSLRIVWLIVSVLYMWLHSEKSCVCSRRSLAVMLSSGSAGYNFAHE